MTRVAASEGIGSPQMPSNQADSFFPDAGHSSPGFPMPIPATSDRLGRSALRPASLHARRAQEIALADFTRLERSGRRRRPFGSLRTCRARPVSAVPAGVLGILYPLRGKRMALSFSGFANRYRAAGARSDRCASAAPALSPLSRRACLAFFAHFVGKEWRSVLLDSPIDTALLAPTRIAAHLPRPPCLRCRGGRAWHSLSTSWAKNGAQFFWVHQSIPRCWRPLGSLRDPPWRSVFLNSLRSLRKTGAPTGNRTPVSALRGPRPNR